MENEYEEEQESIYWKSEPSVNWYNGSLDYEENWKGVKQKWMKI